MLLLPSSRRLLLPSIILLAVATNIRLILVLHEKWQTLQRMLPHPTPLTTIAYPLNSVEDDFLAVSIKPLLTPNPLAVSLLSRCNHTPDPTASHVTLTNPIRNISIPVKAQYFNPAILPLPSHAKHQYLLVSRLVTSGLHQESHICFAKLCLPDSPSCTPEEHAKLPLGGLLCTDPEPVAIPPTPARTCTGAWRAFPDIPGFHDPRIFWGSGAPLIEVNSGSAYGCIGLWVQDLRAVWPVLKEVLARKGGGTVQGPEWNLLGAPVQYKYLTEITKNPRTARDEVEKNWVLFFPGNEEVWVQYDLGSRDVDEINGSDSDADTTQRIDATGSRNVDGVRQGSSNGTRQLNTNGTNQANGTQNVEANSMSKRLSDSKSRDRSVAQMISPGYTTPHLTSPPCLTAGPGHWHQSSNSLRLVLCTRDQLRRRECTSEHVNMSTDAYIAYLTALGLVVHFSIIHRKFSEAFAPRYERYVLVWEARKPFRVLGVSRQLVFAGERGGVAEFFTYTTSIAWKWRAIGEDEREHRQRGHEDLGTGYLGDEMLVGLGIDDRDQGVVVVNVDDMLGCMRLCPGV